MSFFTCFCVLPQKLHFTRSEPSPRRAIVVPDLRRTERVLGIGSRLETISSITPYACASSALMMKSRSVSCGDALDRLAGVVRQQLVEQILHSQDLPCLNLDIRSLTGCSTVWLMDQDTSMGQGIPVTLGPPASSTAAAEAAWP